MEIARLCGFVGGVPERSKGADCKSAGSAFEGSNPSPSTSRETRDQRPATSDETTRPGGGFAALGFLGRTAGPAGRRKLVHRERGGCSSMVEQKPSKLTTRVRFPSPAPTRDAFHGWE